MIGERIGHFRVTSKLGEGGMGVVYRAVDDKLDRAVALKLLPAAVAASEERRRRFEREAKTAASLNHPNVATIYEIGDHDGQLFIAMELIEGETLRERLMGRALPLQETLALARQITDGMAAAHRRGIIHRDLKPENVMLTSSGQAKLLDFGLAKPIIHPLADTEVERAATASAALTREGAVLGTPRYMSPEQVRGEPSDARSDVFAFGSLLYELLMGRGAFDGETAADVTAAILRDEPKPMSDAAEQIPVEVSRIVERCLEKEPEERYADGGAIAAALDESGLLSTSSAVAAPSAADPKSSSKSTHWVAFAAIVGVVAVFAWRAVAPGDESVAPSAPTSSAAATSSAAVAALLEQRRLTSNPASNPVSCAAISPDGKYLVYGDSAGKLIVETLGGNTDRRELGVSPDTIAASCSWHPDSARVVVTEVADFGVGRRLLGRSQGEMWLRSVLSDQARSLGEGVGPRVSPDGKMLAYYKSDGIYVRSLDGGSPRRISEQQTESIIGWSPSGSRLGYLATSVNLSSATYRLESVGAQGSDARVMHADVRLFSGFGVAAAWLPDGRVVFAAAPPAGESFGAQLLSLRVDESGRAQGPPSRIASWLGSAAGDISGTRDGRIALLKVASQTDVWAAELSAGGTSIREPRRLVSDEDDNRTSCFTADSSTLLMSAKRREGWLLEKQALSDDAPTRLDSGNGTWLTWPKVIGDDLLFWRIAAPRTKQPTMALMRRPLSGGNATKLFDVTPPRPLRPHGRPEPAPVVNYDCAAAPAGGCVVAEPSGAKSRVSRFNARTGDKQLVAEVDQLRFMALSPDGGQLAGVSMKDTDSFRVNIFELADGSSRGAPVGCAAGNLDWTADGRALIGACEASLLRLELDGRSRELWSQPGVWLYDPVVAPNGKHIAAVGRSLEANVWLFSQAD